jgi:hypothetical protein
MLIAVNTHGLGQSKEAMRDPLLMEMWLPDGATIPVFIEPAATPLTPSAASSSVEHQLVFSPTPLQRSVTDPGPQRSPSNPATTPAVAKTHKAAAAEMPAVEGEGPPAEVAARIIFLRDFLMDKIPLLQRLDYVCDMVVHGKASNPYKKKREKSKKTLEEEAADEEAERLADAANNSQVLQKNTCTTPTSSKLTAD